MSCRASLPLTFISSLLSVLLGNEAIQSNPLIPHGAPEGSSDLPKVTQQVHGRDRAESQASLTPAPRTVPLISCVTLGKWLNLSEP